MPEFSSNLWNRYWHLLGHRSELGRPKDFVRFNVASEEVVLFNDGAEIIAFDNRCPHRGARIFDDDSGNQPFLCRYHGWSYSKGKIFVADKSQFTHCDLSQLAVNRLNIEWLGDFLFVSKSPCMPLAEQLGSLADIITPISTSIDRLHDFNSYEYECYWPIAVENALEPYHVSSIHPTSLNRLNLMEGRNEYIGLNSIWYTEVGHEQTAKRLKKLQKMFDMGFAHPGYINIFLFPFSMISSTFGLSYSVQNFLPTGNDKHAGFYSRLYKARVRQGINPLLFDDFFSSTAQLNHQVFQEDRAICARVAHDTWSTIAPSVYARSEERLVYFREACRAAKL